MKSVLLKWLVATATGICLISPAAHAQAPATSADAAASASSAEYRVGPGDVLRIVVFQNQDLTMETRVTDAGLVSYPLLGSLRLGGLTIPAVEKLISDGLRNGNFVRQPQVTVALLQVRGHQVSVLGQVNRPGRYPLETADMRLTDVLATAGGTSASGADLVVLSGQRDGKPFRLEVDLPTLFGEGGREKDPVVLNGDAVWVDRQPIVYIYGEVQRPGPMRLEREMTLLQALATGGGLSARGTEKGVRVHRKAADGSVTVMTPGMTDKLREGDVVFVRESLF
jgi:polysaccharide biosynthesis/export protein